MDITELQKLVIAFRDARDWKQFHNPKDLIEATSIEVSELMEHFLWKSQQESYELARTPEAIEEFADIFNYLLTYAEAANIDIVKAVVDKIQKNDEKYPVAKAKGSSEKYTKYGHS